MRIHRDLQNLPLFEKAIVTIGTFDGVHKGHQKIIAQLKEEAAAVNGESLVITFEPHPRKVLTTGGTIQLLNTTAEKIGLLEKEGIDHVVIVPFNEDFSNLTAHEYVEHFLVKNFRPHTIITGYDHRFGKHRSGDYLLLEEMGARYGFNVREIPEQVIQEITISSTKIRDAIQQGNIAMATELLGYNYFFSGIVVDGNKLGRQIGYPTANIHVADSDKLIPANGVYTVKASIQHPQSKIQNFGGMMNIGTRPTIGGTDRVIEVNIFDFNEDIYGKELRIKVIAWLRPEERFNGLEALKEQIGKDKVDSLRILEM